MLIYDNQSRLRLLLELRGSIYSRIWRHFLCVMLYVYALHFASHYYEDWMPAVDNPFVAQSFGTLMAFAVCFRVNIAWNRFWEGCREMYFMFSKWSDAYSQLQCFINYSMRSPFKKADQDTLRHARNELTHYFSLLSALAYERLSRGDICRIEKRGDMRLPWKDLVVAREDLWEQELTGYKQLVPMRTRYVHPKNAANINGTPFAQDAVGSDAPDLTGLESWDLPASVVGECSALEKQALQASRHRVQLVNMWINELVTTLHHHLDVPTPILSRVYQELAAGALGYSQAEKLADIPFPFIFTQLLSLQVLLFAVLFPWVFIVTGKSWLSPIISIVVVVSYWALNEIAKELENPFGNDANDMPLHDAHERFVELLAEMHRTTLPEDREYWPEGLHPDQLPHRAAGRKPSLLYLKKRASLNKTVSSLSVLHVENIHFGPDGRSLRSTTKALHPSECEGPTLLDNDDATPPAPSGEPPRRASGGFSTH